jgi:hypothetical protein
MRPPRLCVKLGVAIGILALVGWLDYVTGYELQFFVFYFLPVSLAAWCLGRTTGLAFAVLSAATWLAADVWSGHPYADRLYLIWNTAIRLAAFLAMASAFSRIRAVLDDETRLRKEVERAMSEIKQLRGLLPICAACKRIRNDAGLWEQVELYIRSRTEAEFTHGLCPECAVRLYGADIAACSQRAP